MRRFLGIAGSQLVSLTGSAMTAFAVPLWIYLETGSLVNFALFAAVSLVPGMLVLPFAGVLVDRHSRRAVMLVSDTVSATVQVSLLVLLLTGSLQIWHIYALLSALSVAVTFHRLAYASAIPQIVPKRYLGHANGLVQVGNGVGQFLVPVAAVGVLAAIGLEGILFLDVLSYAVATTVLVLVRFPVRMAYRRRETMATEIRSGFRYAMGSPGLRAMLLFFASINIFLGPLLILIQPLVLDFGTLRSVTEVSVAGGIGATVGGVAMALWGGPARRKMLGVLCSALALAVAAAIAGLRPSVPVVATGVFGMFVGLTIMNAIYATIVQVKIPARFHGRVFAVNTLFAFCTLPIGFIVVGPTLSGALNPLLEPGGALAGTVGQLIGTGPGRGTGLTYILLAAAIAVLAAVALRYRPLARFDRDVPDAEPDDLVGIAALHRRTATRDTESVARRLSSAPTRPGPSTG
jgi:MFS family permease